MHVVVHHASRAWYVLQGWCCSVRLADGWLTRVNIGTVGVSTIQLYPTAHEDVNELDGSLAIKRRRQTAASRGFAATVRRQLAEGERGYVEMTLSGHHVLLVGAATRQVLPGYQLATCAQGAACP
jgi:hypothetical protein